MKIDAVFDRWRSCFPSYGDSALAAGDSAVRVIAPGLRGEENARTVNPLVEDQRKGVLIMATFLKSEAEVLVLANDMKAGLTANAEDFADPPVSPTMLSACIVSVQTAMDKVTAARSAAEAATEEKAAAMAALVTAIKKNL